MGVAEPEVRVRALPGGFKHPLQAAPVQVVFWKTWWIPSSGEEKRGDAAKGSQGCSPYCACVAASNSKRSPAVVRTSLGSDPGPARHQL